MNKLLLKKNASTVLTVLASAGVVATTVLAINATPKAIKCIEADSVKNHDGDSKAYTKKEAVASAWKFYIPTAAVGVSTIVCILGANTLNRHQQATLTSAYALIQNSYKEYKEKLKELYGEEAHNKIIDSIVSEKAKNVDISASGGWYNSSLDFGECVEPEIIRTFYDDFSDRYFESTIEKVIQAEYHLNRNFLFKGTIALNEYYEFLGLEETELGNTVGWSSVNGDIYWIDFNHRKITLDDGMQIFVIEMIFEPSADWLEDI